MTLFAKIPPKNTARIRFTLGRKNLLSEFIVLEQGAQFAHAEAVLSDGTIVASIINIGVQHYPNNEWYNSGTTDQQFIDLPMTADQYANWVNYLFSIVGSKFDDEAAIGILFGLPLHCAKEFICSMVVISSLVNPKVKWCRMLDADQITTPTQLLWMLKADKRCIVHPPESESNP